MKDPLVTGQVLRELHTLNRVDPRGAQTITEGRHDVGRSVEQLTCRRRVTDGVGALAQESQTRPSAMEPCPHPVSVLCRCSDRHWIDFGKLRDAGQRVTNELRLERKLARIRNVPIRLPAARRIAAHDSSVSVRRDHVDDGRMNHVAALAIDTNAHMLARDGADDEYDTTLMARQHRTTDHGPLGMEL